MHLEAIKGGLPENECGLTNIRPAEHELQQGRAQ